MGTYTRTPARPHGCRPGTGRNAHRGRGPAGRPTSPGDRTRESKRRSLMSVTDSWQNAERVLCVRLDALGDVLMTTPALRALKESNPGRQLTLLTSPSGAAVAPLVPEIDCCWIYESPWVKSTPCRQDSLADRAMIERLRDGRFDAAVIFTVYSQNPLPAAMLCYLSDIPLRLAHCRENPYQLLTDWVVDD